MKALLVSLTLVVLSGCATTSYEKCTKGGQSDRYGSVDACVSNLEEERLFRRQQHSDYWKSWTNEPVVINKTQSEPPKTCLTDYVNGKPFQHCY